jgi:hypothetical protein
MRKLFTLFIISFLIFPLASHAGIYGTLKGKVVDDEGKPVLGATIKIVGTPRGTYVRDKDGKFTIVNLNAGEFQVQVTAVGYAKYTATVRISADDITELNVKLKSERIETKTVNVDATRVLVNNTDIGTTRKISGNQVTDVAREGLTQVIALSAGVVSYGGGYSIRGSRPTESQIRVNGIDIGNQFTGGFGLGGVGYFPMISTYATEEVQTLTGSFSAEYGQALGGIVNAIPKVGRTDHFEGYMRWYTDVDFLWGSKASDLFLQNNGSNLSAILSGPGQQLQGPQQNNVEFGVGGPIPILENSSFYLSSNYLYEKYRNASYAIYGPVDVNNPSQGAPNLGLPVNDRSWKKNISLNTRFGITKDIYLILGGMWGLSSFEYPTSNSLYSSTVGDWRFATSTGIINGTDNGVPEYTAKLPVGNTLVMNLIARINHSLSDKSFYEITIANNTNNDEISKRNLYPNYTVSNYLDHKYMSASDIKNPTIDPSFFGGFNLWYPNDQATYDAQFNLVPGKDKIIDEYETQTANNIATADGYLKMATRIRNPITGYIEGDADYSGYNNPYGLSISDAGVAPFYTHGNTRNFDFRESNYWQIEGSFTQSIEGEFTHMFKAGLDFRFYQLDRSQNSLPWTADPFFDVYTAKWGGNLYALDSATWAMTSKPYRPILGALYVQDQITYKGIIISPGLRLDFFTPQSRYRLSNTTFTSIMADSGFADTKMKFQLSPRVNVAYPITDRSNVSVAYGMYFKVPEFQSLYDGFGTAILRGNSILGNPNIAPQRENTYQVSYSNQLSDEFAFDMTAYYRDVYNQLGTIYVPNVPNPYYQTTVSEYGNARGLEINFRKTATLNDHIGFLLNYTLASVTGTSSAAGDNYLLAIDPFTGQPAYPLAEFPLSNDRTHRVNFNLNFRWGDKQGPSIAGIQPIENSSISVTTVFQSGAPYTKVDLKGRPVGELNSQRGPSYWMTDMRLSREFFFKDLLGDGAGNTSIEFFVEIYNLFNRTSPSGFWVITGSPDDDGSSFYVTKGSFSSTPLYKEADFSNPATFMPDQYDNFGNRRYNANADFDHNGVVTQDEKYLAYVKTLEDLRKFQTTYLQPIRVWFGIMLRF